MNLKMTSETFLKYPLEETLQQGSQKQAPPETHGTQWGIPLLLRERSNKPFQASLGRQEFQILTLCWTLADPSENKMPPNPPSLRSPAKNQSSGKLEWEMTLLPGGGELEWQPLGLHRLGAGSHRGANPVPGLPPSRSAPALPHPHTHPAREGTVPDTRPSTTLL